MARNSNPSNPGWKSRKPWQVQPGRIHEEHLDALDRLGIYCRRADFQRVVLLSSSGLPDTILERAQAALVGQQVEIMRRCEVGSSTYEHALAVFQSLPTNISAIIGLGGGKALDVVKITAVFDWKLAFHACGTPINDFAALLSDATVFQLMANPQRDLEGIRLLATSLKRDGLNYEVAPRSVVVLVCA